MWKRSRRYKSAARIQISIMQTLWDLLNNQDKNLRLGNRAERCINRIEHMFERDLNIKYYAKSVNHQ